MAVQTWHLRHQEIERHQSTSQFGQEYGKQGHHPARKMFHQSTSNKHSRYFDGSFSPGLTSNTKLQGEASNDD
jgi:hypothetical protein